MSEISIKTDVYTPETTKTVSFQGYHPSRLLSAMPNLLMDVFKLESAGIYEDQFKWDDSVDPDSFYVIWRGLKGFDKFSKFVFSVVIMGTQNKKDKMGSANVTMRAEIKTTMGQKTPLHWIANRVYMSKFYNDFRRKYVKMAKEEVTQFEEEVKALFNLMERSKI